MFAALMLNHVAFLSKKYLWEISTYVKVLGRYYIIEIKVLILILNKFYAPQHCALKILFALILLGIFKTELHAQELDCGTEQIDSVVIVSQS